jgi:molybdopterin-guanine dinucleotide biosynthesis protein MobB
MAYTVIILAGGKSRRFGYDKTLLEVNGVRIIETIVEKCTPVFSEILIAGGDRCDIKIPGVRTVPDTYRNIGPLGGIHAGLSAASNEVCFVTACDMPNFRIPTVKKLLDSSQGYDVALFKAGEYIQPLFAAYNKSILPLVEQLLSQNTNSVLRLFDTARVCCIEIPAERKKPENDLLFNINYKEDYEMFINSAPPVLSVVGFTDSGKTTYLEKLIPALKSRGIRLGVIKHDAHSFDIDIPGKDSWRLTQAGADITVISSPAKIAILEKWSHEEDLAHLAVRLRGKVDLILTEGYKRDKARKIEIRRAAKNRDAFCEDAELFAVASDFALESDSTAPVLPLDDAEPMADLIMKFLEDG